MHTFGRLKKMNGAKALNEVRELTQLNAANAMNELDELNELNELIELVSFILRSKRTINTHKGDSKQGTSSKRNLTMYSFHVPRTSVELLSACILFGSPRMAGLLTYD